MGENIKQPSGRNAEKEEVIRLISSSYGILHTWLLIWIHLKEVADDSQKDTFNTVFETTIKMLVSHQNSEVFGGSIRSTITSLLNRLGSLNFSKNMSFTSSILLNDDRTKQKTLEECTLL